MASERIRAQETGLTITADQQPEIARADLSIEVNTLDTVEDVYRKRKHDVSSWRFGLAPISWKSEEGMTGKAVTGDYCHYR